MYIIMFTLSLLFFFILLLSILILTSFSPLPSFPTFLLLLLLLLQRLQRSLRCCFLFFLVELNKINDRRLMIWQLNNDSLHIISTNSCCCIILHWMEPNILSTFFLINKSLIYNDLYFLSIFIIDKSEYIECAFLRT